MTAARIEKEEKYQFVKRTFSITKEQDGDLKRFVREGGWNSQDALVRIALSEFFKKQRVKVAEESYQKNESTIPPKAEKGRKEK